MSECVVRMEMPESCKKCKNPLCLWLNDDGDFIVDHTIAAVQDFRKKNDDGFPDFCPIICSLQEGHGRLVDARAFIEHVYTEWQNGEISNSEWCDIRQWVNEETTIVPAERSEHEAD